MTERTPPTPDTGDYSFAVDAPKKSLDAETCVLINFYAQTYPGGELLLHNLWFHESWSGFDAPYNIMFVEKDGKPMVLILPRAPEGTPKEEFDFEIMEFHGPRPERSERDGSQANNSRTRNPNANTGRASSFRAYMNRAGRMFDGVRIPAVEIPPAQWWRRKLKLLLKMVLAMMVIFLVIQGVSYAPQLRDIIKSKFPLTNQANSYSNYFNTDGGYFKTGRNFFKTERDHSNANRDNSNTKRNHANFGKSHSNADRRGAKATKDHFKTNRDNTKRDNTKTDKGHFKFSKNADGNHVRGAWAEPDDTHVTFEASKTSGGDPPVTEIKFVHTEEQFIKDDNDAVLFSWNRVTRFLVTLVGGDEHDEKLDKIMDGLGSMSSKGKKKVRSRRWWWWW